MAARLGATFVPGRDNDDYFMPELVAPAPQRVTPQVPQNMQDDLQRLELEARESEFDQRQLSLSSEPPILSTNSPLSGPGRPPKIPDKIPQLPPLDADFRTHLHKDEGGRARQIPSPQPQPQKQPQQQQHQYNQQQQPQHQHQQWHPQQPQQQQQQQQRLTPSPQPQSQPLQEHQQQQEHHHQQQQQQYARKYSTNGSDKPYDKMGWDEPSFSPFPKVQGDNVPPADDEKEKILWKARDHVLHSQNISMQITWARDVLIWAEVSMDAAIREAADKGTVRPSTPRIEHELRVDALNIIKHLASQEHPDALYIRAKWFEFGKFGERMDKREAFAGYKLAAELGNSRSEYRMGMLFEQSNDMSKAKEHYYRGLSLRDSASQYRMGMISLLGQHGESKDYHGGLERIRNAAEGADEDAPQGAYVYGMLIARDLPDISVPEGLLSLSIDAAKMYVEKAAYLGFAKAQLKMGQAYELCQLGCDFNPSFSLHYYGLAAKQGVPEAALGVSRWFLFGYEGVFKKNEELAYQYARDAATAKLPTGEFAMGYYHEIGIHVNKSIPEARRWYQLAADHGNHDAIGRLESLSQDRSLSKQDHETTTHTRIKSQHGSQRGKRPDRFAKPQTQMPTLNEGSGSPNPVGDGGLGRPPNAAGPNGQSPRVSPLPSPAARPTIVTDHTSFAEPSRASFVTTGSTGGQAATGLPAVSSSGPFNIRLDTEGFGQPLRAIPGAPYPTDDRPQPLNLRGKGSAPYPEDDTNHRPGYHHGQGPAADRAGSAFGINPQGGPRMGPGQGGNLYPQNGPNAAGRGRAPSGGYDPHGPGGGGNGSRPGTAGQGGRGYGPPQNGPGGIPPAGTRPGGPPGPSGPGGPGGPPRTPTNLPQGGQAPGSATRPPPSRTATAPVGQAAPASSSPAGGKAGKGPATFEDMGIPQGKQDGECVVM